MKKSKIIIPALLFVLTAATVTPFLLAEAATTPPENETATTSVRKVENYMPGKNWNKNMYKNWNKNMNKNKTPKTAAEITALKSAQAAKGMAIKSALASSDYDAWVKAINTNVGNITNPNNKANSLTSKITKENFPKFVEAYNLEMQLQAKLAELGINKVNDNEMMSRVGMGMGNGYGYGMGMSLGLGR